MSLSRADRRRLDRYQASVEKVTAADAAFFERRPERFHRVRLAAVAEVAQNRVMAGVEDTRVGPGERWLVLVKQVAPGVRVRAFAKGVGFDDFDFGEAEARELYNSHVRPGSQPYEVEMRMRAALAKMGAPR